jgi:hypothetical protein
MYLSARSAVLGSDDWRSEERYASLDDAPPSSLAWEFLRRNPDYQRDFEALKTRSAFSAEMAARAGPIQRWGLTFRRRSGPVGG